MKQTYTLQDKQPIKLHGYSEVPIGSGNTLKVYCYNGEALGLAKFYDLNSELIIEYYVSR